MSRVATLCGMFGILFFCLACTCLPELPFCTPPPCTTDANCATGELCDTASGDCVECLVDADCDPGSVCSEAGGNVCVDCITDAQCADTNDCTADTCASAACVHTNVADGTACADETPANTCTRDTCTGGACTHTPTAAAGTACGSATDDDCTNADTCDAAGVCQANNAADGTTCADDGNDCTDEACAAGVCASTDVADDTACDDDDICTDPDTCTAGACGGTAVVDCCESDADCTAPDICNTTTNLCEPPVPACVADLGCDDDDDCTTDTCTEGECVYADNTAPCNDGNACTTGDVCAAGACAGTPVVCPSGQVCNSATGNCADIPCTTDANCNDNAACTADSCNQVTGLCEFEELDVRCNDNQYCNGDEGEGSCDPNDPDAEAVSGCVRPGDPCVDGPDGFGKVCNESTDTCIDCTTNAQCNDGHTCTSDTCAAGTCNHTELDNLCPDPLKCDGIDRCNPDNDDADATTGCYAPGNPCEPRVCKEATYVEGDPATCTDCASNADCSDDITCTKDTCDGNTGFCAHNEDDDLCPDTLFCNGDDRCDPEDSDADANGCVNGLAFLVNAAGVVGYPCANACKESNNTCFDCTSNLECSDGISCTDDTCDGNTGDCTHSDNCDGGFICNLQSGQCEVD